MFDLNRTIKLIKGALFDREATWQAYLPEAGDWKKTAIQLTIPLIVASGVIAYVVSLFAGDPLLPGMPKPTILTTLLGFVLGAIAAVIVALIFSSLAGVFGGKASFAHGLAATTLAFVFGYVGQALAWLPWIGRLLMFVLAIFSLVQLWKIIPSYLEVPDGKRTMHFVVSIIVAIVVMMIVGRFVSPMLYGPDAGSPFASMSQSREAGDSSGNMFSDVVRRAAIVEEANKDTYTPPADGKISERQMREYVAVMEEVIAAQRENWSRMEETAKKAEEDGELSVSEFAQMTTAMTQGGGMHTLEIESVRDAGGNWAEHEWVRDSLMIAAAKGGGSEALDHNYRLYRKYADQLRPYSSGTSLQTNDNTLFGG